MANYNPPRDGEGDRAKRGGGGAQSLRRPEVYSARKLRRKMSLPEVLLWQALRGQKNGLKFRRQHPVGPYVADFYCPSIRLVIEIDGEAHNCGDQPGKDLERDNYMQAQNHKVLRIAAVDVLNRMADVMTMIVREADDPLHRAVGTVPLPVNGEDLT